MHRTISSSFSLAKEGFFHFSYFYIRLPSSCKTVYLGFTSLVSPPARFVVGIQVAPSVQLLGNEEILPFLLSWNNKINKNFFFPLHSLHYSSAISFIYKIKFLHSIKVYTALLHSSESVFSTIQYSSPPSFYIDQFSQENHQTIMEYKKKKERERDLSVADQSDRTNFLTPEKIRQTLLLPSEKNALSDSCFECIIDSIGKVEGSTRKKDDRSESNVLWNVYERKKSIRRTRNNFCTHFFGIPFYVPILQTHFLENANYFVPNI